MTTTGRLSRLPEVPASDVKKRGWRGVMRAVPKDGAVVVTNHDEPEAVILRVDAYEALLERLELANSRAAIELDALRKRFDERLAVLRDSDAGERLRALARKPARLGGKVKAGTGF